MAEKSPSRYITNDIKELALNRDKMAFISGPRQVGKTTLSKSFLNSAGSYFNWDDSQFRRIWAKHPASLVQSLSPGGERQVLIFDEIHKAKKWKQSLKGIYDTLSTQVDILVTGSARLDIYQKGSDSLHGRYIPFRLHPFSVGELLHGKHLLEPDTLLKQLLAGDLNHDAAAVEALGNLLKFSGFPEPLFSAKEKILNIWQRTRIDKIVREDLRDLSRIPDLSQIEMLIALLPERAAQPLSRAALREDLEVAHTTITRWLSYLESLYYHFEIKPYFKRIKNSLKKEGKIFLWDYSEVQSDGSRFENLVASHLLKACHYWTDIGIGRFELRYLRDKLENEIDFLIIRDNKPFLPIEVKTSDTSMANGWKRFIPQIKCELGVQIVNMEKVLSVKKIEDAKVLMVSASTFLKYLP